jgi:hypothetical protein
MEIAVIALTLGLGALTFFLYRLVLALEPRP